VENVKDSGYKGDLKLINTPRDLVRFFGVTAVEEYLDPFEIR